MAAEEVLLQRRVRRPGEPQPRPAKMTRGQLVASTTRCSARPTPRSAPKRAACTSARAWRSCSRCPAPSAATYQLVETTMPGQLQQGRDVAVRRHRHQSIAGLAQFAGAHAAEGSDRRPDAIVRRGQAAQKAFDTRQRRGDAAAAARRACAPSASLRGAAAHACRSTRRRGSRSISACARRNASSSRRSSLAQRRPRRGAGRRRRRRARAAGEGRRHRREPRRGRRDGQAGEVRRLRQATRRAR